MVSFVCHNFQKLKNKKNIVTDDVTLLLNNYILINKNWQNIPPKKVMDM